MASKSPALSGSLRAPLRSVLDGGLRYHRAGELAAAVAAYRRVLLSAPRNFDALHMLGVALVQLKQLDEGVQLLRRALQVSPESANCKLNLANALIEAGQHSEAIALFQSLLSVGQANETVLRGLLQCLNALERHKDALALGQKAVARFPGSAELHNEIGRALTAAGSPREAAESYRRAVTLKPAFVSAACNLGNALTELKQFEEAEAVLRRVLTLEPGNVQALTNLAHMYRTNWQAEKAIDTARLALAIQPDNAGLQTFVGGCLIDLGQNEEAEKVFRGMLQRNLQVRDAVVGLAQIHKFKEGDPEIGLVQSLLDDGALSAKNRKPLLFTKAKIEDDLGHHGAAVEAAIAAKAIEPFPSPITDYRNYVTGCMRLMDQAFFERARSHGSRDERPVFILGMPRSGTTLTEQIVASHPQADGAGELTALPAIAEAIGFRTLAPADLVAKLDALSATERQSYQAEYLSILRKDRKASAVRITDKLPHNFEHIWLAAFLFPDARIIHCKRNPVDVSISIFLRNFSAGHWYSQDLAMLGQYLNLYKQQVAHWRQVCGLSWYENDYEQLVADPEPNIRRMIDFLGLPWDDKCLSHTETERSVHTFSKVQVRQPIYRSSVDRWKKYAPYIGPLLKELGIPAP